MDPELASFYRSVADRSISSVNPDGVYEFADRMAADPVRFANSFGEQDGMTGDEIRASLDSLYLGTAIAGDTAALDHAVARAQEDVDSTVGRLSRATGVPVSDVASAYAAALRGDVAAYDAVLNTYFG